jgi:hypothetical protein
MKASKNNRRVSVIPNEMIMKQIYFVRGEKVMIDKDLASLYAVETKNLNRAVIRNAKRFPEDFMFQLTKEEAENLRFQIGIPSWGGNRRLPHVFTEQGVAMLSGVLNSARAIRVNIQIMRVFTEVRKMLFDNSELRLAIEQIRKKTENNTKNIEVVFQYFDEFISSKETPRKRRRRPIGFVLPHNSKRKTTRKKRK